MIPQPRDSSSSQKRWWKRLPSPIDSYERRNGKRLTSYQFMASLCFILSLSGFMHSFMVSYGGFIESSNFLTNSPQMKDENLFSSNSIWNESNRFLNEVFPTLTSISPSSSPSFVPSITSSFSSISPSMSFSFSPSFSSTTSSPFPFPTDSNSSVYISFSPSSSPSLHESIDTQPSEVIIINETDDDKETHIEDDEEKKNNIKNEKDHNNNNINDNKDNNNNNNKIYNQYNILKYFTLEAQQFFFLGEGIGTFLSYLLTDHIGRRRILILSQILNCFLLIYNIFFFSSTISSWLTIRFFHGIIIGIILCSTIIYMIEISTSKFRGKSFVCFTLMLCLGYSASEISFHYMSSVHGNDFIPSYKTFLLQGERDNQKALWWSIVYSKWWWWFWLYSFIPLLLSVFQILTLLPLPDSPRWILANKTPSDCSKSLKFLRRKMNIKKEFNYMYRELAYDARQGRSWKDLLCTNSSLKYRIIINFILQFITNFINFWILIIYSSSVFISTRMMNISIQILILVLLTCSLFLFVFLNKTIDRKGRKFIWKVGIFLSTILWLLITISSYYCELSLIHSSIPYNNKSKINSNFASNILDNLKIFDYFDKSFFIKLSWFTFSFSLILLASTTLMLQNNLSWLYSCEIFPFRIRSKGCSLTLSFRFILISLLLPKIKYIRFFLASISPIFGTISLSIDNNSTSIFQTSRISVSSLPMLLMILTIINLTSSLLVYIVIPETNGVILEEIEEIFTLDKLNYFCGCIPYWDASNTRGSINSSNDYTGTFNEDDNVSIEGFFPSRNLSFNSINSTEKNKKLSSLDPYISLSSTFNFMNSPNPLFNYGNLDPSNELEVTEIDRLLMKPTPLFPFNPFEKSSTYGTIQTPPSMSSTFISPIGSNLNPILPPQYPQDSMLFSPVNASLTSSHSSSSLFHCSNSPVTFSSYQHLPMIDPSTLHKYSYEMNSSNFFYQSDDEEDVPSRKSSISLFYEDYE